MNNILVETYWQIGQQIRIRQVEQGWGAQVIDKLSVDLRQEHPDMRGLSRRNLYYMAAMAARWPHQIVQHAAAQLPWGHVMVLLDKCPDQATSDFYAQCAVDEGWTRENLETMMRDLKKALTGNLVRLLRELGAGFAFVGSEVSVMCGPDEYFIDVLFYHYRLHRFLVFELKTERFRPEFVGKLNFYVQLVDENYRDLEVDDRTVGILLVVGRDDVTVEFGLRDIGSPLAVSEWRSLPPEVQRALPSPGDLTRAVTQAIREVGDAGESSAA